MYIRPCHKTEQWQQNMCVLSMLNITKYSKRGHKMVLFLFCFYYLQGIYHNGGPGEGKNVLKPGPPGPTALDSLRKIRCECFR